MLRRAVAGLAVLAILALASGARADTYTVTRTDDPPPNGCKPKDCSLREAVRAANATSARDTIVLKAHTYRLTIKGADENAAATGDLDVKHDLVVTGSGPANTTIEGAWASTPDRLLEVLGPGTKLAMKGLTLRDGDAGNDVGSGITVTNGSLSLTNVNLTSMDNGFAIDNFGNAKLVRVNFTNDSAGTGCCAGFYNDSAGAKSSTVHMTDVSFVGNHAGLDTGAMYSSGELAVLRNVTFANNIAGNVGGALITAGGTTKLTNVTFSGNQDTGNGGAIYAGSGELDLNNVTIAGNVADSDNSGGGDGGGIYRNGGTIKMQNTIVAGNSDLSTTGTVAPDCSQFSGDAFTSTGHNLIGDNSGCTFTPLTSDLFGTGGSALDPKLASLADNGGFTKTRALKASSPAIDAGSPKAPGSGGTACAAKDQRGVKRPQGPDCDIGAYEKKQ